MAKLNIEIENPHGKAKLEIEGAKAEVTRGVVDGLFRVLKAEADSLRNVTEMRIDVKPADFEKLKSTLSEPRPIRTEPKSSVATETLKKKVADKEVEYDPTSRIVHKEGDGEPSTMAEALARVNMLPTQTTEKEEFWETGIKYKDSEGQTDVPHYRTRYKCPTCQRGGKHYPPLSANYVKCHGCETKIAIKKPDTMPTEPEKDAAGNFFYAEREFVEGNQ